MPKNKKRSGMLSAGNHAQGVAKSRNLLEKWSHFHAHITPRQKIEQVNMFGGQYVKVILEGDTYDDSYEAAKKYCADHDETFIHPFDDLQVIEGQATLAYEILEQTERK